PPTKIRRAAADVRRDIEDLAGDDADELALRPADLIMQPAQHAPPRARVIVLDEARADSRALELPLVPALIEEPARVAENAGLDEQHFRESGRRSLHLSRGSSRSSDSR